MDMIFKFAFRNILRNKRRTIITSLSIFFAGIIAVFAMGWITGMLGVLMNNYIKYQTGNFRIVSGAPYCVGGCHGIFLDWLHMIKDRKPALLKRFPRLTAVVGKTEKKITDRRVLLVGDCARASTAIHSKRVVCIKGCPPSHKRIVWDMMIRYFLLAPLVRPSLIIDGFVLYPLKKFKGWLINL